MKCRDCLNELGSRCSLKNVKVNVSKNRKCMTFLQRDSAPFERVEIESTYVPYNLRSMKAMKAYLHDNENYIAENEPDMTPDCLANFRSSANA